MKEEGQWRRARVAQNSGDQTNEDTVLRRGHTNTMGQSQMRVKSFYLGEGRLGGVKGECSNGYKRLGT